MLHISIFNIPDKHLISTCFSIILWGVYNPCMVLSMKVAHEIREFRKEWSRALGIAQVHASRPETQPVVSH